MYKRVLPVAAIILLAGLSTYSSPEPLYDDSVVKADHAARLKARRAQQAAEVLEEFVAKANSFAITGHELGLDLDLDVEVKDISLHEEPLVLDPNQRVRELQLTELLANSNKFAFALEILVPPWPKRLYLGSYTYLGSPPGHHIRVYVDVMAREDIILYGEEGRGKVVIPRKRITTGSR